MTRLRHTLLYVLLDAVLAFGGWLLYWLVRKELVEVGPSSELIIDKWLFAKAGTATLVWLTIHWAMGLYRMPVRRSRLKEFTRVLVASVIGVLIIGLSSFLNDPIGAFTNLRRMLWEYFVLQSVIVGGMRFVVSSYYKHRLLRGKIRYNTLIIGQGRQAEKLLDRLREKPRLAPGYHFLGYVRMPDAVEENRFYGKLKRIGDLNDLADILKRRRIEEVVVAIDHHREVAAFNKIVRDCKSHNVRLNVSPNMTDLLVGNVRMTNVYGAPFVEISPHLISPFQGGVKRALDITASGLALLIGLPIFVLLAVLVKASSPGSVFYQQERIGKDGKPFYITKFRSMRTDAEASGPALSQDRDPRITSVGRFLRKSHLDEIPQFWHVLIGDMSLVGPRPERQFFIDQIVERAPEFTHLLKVRPGITSWGQVQYGYASSVDEMVERLKYDLIYIENMSLALDLKIMVYTVLRVFEGDGK